MHSPHELGETGKVTLHLLSRLVQKMQKYSHALVILAAGKSSRVRQLSFDRPKSLLSINGQRIIERLIFSFAHEYSKIVIVAGMNSRYFEFLRDYNFKSIEIIDDQQCTTLSSSYSLFCGIDILKNEIIDTVEILEADIVLSHEAVEAFKSEKNTPKFIVLQKECGIDDDKVSFHSENSHFSISKDNNKDLVYGNYLGAVSLDGKKIIELSNCLEKYISNPYTFSISKLLNEESNIIFVDENNGYELDTGADYYYILNNSNLSKTVTDGNKIHPGLKLGEHTKRWVGVYDILGSKIAQKTGFDGVWLGSFQLSLVNGVQDDESYNPVNILPLAREIRQKKFKGSIILDAAQGWDQADEAKKIIEQCINAGIDAIVIDDNPSERLCSLFHRQDYDLIGNDQYFERIQNVTKAAKGKIETIARTEAIIQGNEQLARQRANIAYKAGAQAFIPHYVGESLFELEKILGGYVWPLPIVIIPTGLLTVPINLLSKIGCSGIVYANIDIRLRAKNLVDALSSLSSQGKFSAEHIKLLSSPEEVKNIATDETG